MSKKNKVEIFKLEERVLFEAGAVIQAAEAAAAEQANNDAMTADAGSIEGESAELAQLAEMPVPPEMSGSDDVIDAVTAFSAVTPSVDPIAFTDAPFLQPAADKVLVILNSSVADADTLIKDLGDNVEVLKLTAGTDAMDAINDYLDEHADTKYSAIHLVSHGSEGYITLNGEKIDSTTINPADWKAIGDHLTDDADILVYGCDTAKSDEGKALVQTIANLTGADVAASTDATGATGNWDLEYRSGLIEAATIKPVSYQYDLPATTITVNSLEDSADDGSAETTTLREAITEANTNGGEYIIVFGQNLAKNADLDGNTENGYEGYQINLTSTLSISKSGLNLTIDGMIGTDRVILDGGKNGNRMIIANTSGVNLSLENLVLQNGKTTGKTTHGAALYGGSGVDLHVTNVLFRDNSVTGASATGGAIYFAGGELVIKDSVFTGNSAKTTGGAIYTNAATINLVIQDSIFAGNTASTTGGAIMLDDVATATIDGSKFINNNGGSGGGAIYTHMNNRVLTFTDSLFDANIATYGGAIMLQSAWNSGKNYVDMVGLTVINNEATVAGGGILITNQNQTTIADSTIVGNIIRTDKALGTYSGNTTTYGGAGVYTGSVPSPGPNNGQRADLYLIHNIMVDNNMITTGADGTTEAGIKTNSDFYSGQTYQGAGTTYLFGNVYGASGKITTYNKAPRPVTYVKVNSTDYNVSGITGADLFDSSTWNADGKFIVDNNGLVQLKDLSVNAELGATVNRTGFQLGSVLSGSHQNYRFSIDGGMTWYSPGGTKQTVSPSTLYLRDQTGGMRLPYSTAGAAQYKPAIMWSVADDGTIIHWSTVEEAVVQLESGDGEYYFAPKVQNFGDVTVNGSLILHGFDADSELAANFILADATDAVTVNGMKYAGGATISAGNMTIENALLTGEGDFTVTGGVFTVVNTTVSGFSGTITVDAAATAQVVNSSLYDNSGTITGNGALNILNTLVFGTENLSGYTAKYSVFDIAGTDAYNTYSANAADVFGSELVWDGLVLTSLQATAGSTAPHSKGALAAVNGGNLYYSTDNMNWKNFADDSAATVDSAYIIAVDALGNPRKVMSGNASVGVYASLMEAASLMVTIATDVVDRYDGYTSLREAVLYAQNGEVALNYDSNGDGTMDTYRITFDAAAIAGNTETGFTMRANEDGRIYVDLMVNAEGYSSALVFTTADNLIIDGEDQNITIDISQGSASRVFYLNTGTLTVKNLAVFGTGAAGKQSSETNGGLVLVEGGKTFTADNVEFAYSNILGAADTSGAFYTGNGNIIVNNSDFHHNNAANGAALFGSNGGAGTIRVTGGRIHDNTVSGHIFVGWNGSMTYLTNVEIDHNKTGKDKHIIYYERSADFYLDQVNVHDNTGGSNASAFLCVGQGQANVVAKITNSAFYDNAFGRLIWFGSTGGSGVSFTLADSTIYNNTFNGVDDNRYIIAIAGNSTETYSVNVYNNTIAGNTSTQNVLYALQFSTNNDVSLLNNIILDNHGTVDTGSISVRVTGTGANVNAYGNIYETASVAASAILNGVTLAEASTDLGEHNTLSTVADVFGTEELSTVWDGKTLAISADGTAADSGVLVGKIGSAYYVMKDGKWYAADQSVYADFALDSTTGYGLGSSATVYTTAANMMTQGETQVPADRLYSLNNGGSEMIQVGAHALQVVLKEEAAPVITVPGLTVTTTYGEAVTDLTETQKEITATINGEEVTLYLDITWKAVDGIALDGTQNAGIYENVFTVDTVKAYNTLGEDVTAQYEFNSADVVTSLTIKRAAITVSGITAENKGYDGTTDVVLNYSGVTFGGLVEGDTLTVTATGTFADANAKAGQIVNLSGLTLGGDSLANYELAAEGQQTTATADISKAQISVTALDSGKSVGTADPVLEYELTSGKLYGSDTITIKREAGENVGTYAINVFEVADSNNGGNYEVTLTPGVFTISANTATVTVTTETVTYNGNDQQAKYTVTGLADGHTVKSITLGSARNAGTHTLSASDLVIQDAEGNDVTAQYSLTYNTGVLTIEKATLTVVANAQEIVYGSADPELTYTATGLLGTDSVTLDRVAGTDAGTYAINSCIVDDGNAEGDNYTLNFTAANLTITAKEITISNIAAANREYNGLTDAAVTFDMSGILDVDADKVTLTATGAFVDGNAGENKQVDLTWSLTGEAAGNYKLAGNEAATTANITAKEVALDWTASDSYIYTGADQSETVSATYTDVNGEVQSVVISFNESFKNAGTYTATAESVANYTFTNATKALTIGKATVTLTLSDAAKVYGEADPELTYTVSGIVDGAAESDIVDAALTRADGENVGKYLISATAASKSDNYDVVVAEQAAYLTVTAKAITISNIAAADREYNGLTGADVTFDKSGILDADAADVTITATGAFADKNVGTDKNVDITWALTGDAAGNYKLTGNDATTLADITAKEITISGITAENKVYDGETSADLNVSNISFIGKVDGDSLSYNATGAFADKNAADGKTVALTITLTGDDAANYILAAATQTETTANITAKEITVNGITAADKIYDGNTTAALNFNGATFGGIVDGDTLTVTATGAFTDANTGTDKMVNLSGLTLGGESAGNYVLATSGNQTETTADITAVNVTLDWEAETSYTYNGADQSGTVKAYYTDVNGAKVYVSVNLGDGVTFKNAGDYTASAEGSAADSNYAYAASTKSLTIDKAVVTVNGITAANKIYDGNTTATLNFSGATFGGIVDGDTLTVTATGAFADANAGTGKTVNLSGLTLGGESLGNYILATTGNQTTANADIVARAISIVVDNVSMFEGKTEPALTYELTNGMLVNGDTIELSRVAGTTAGSYAINGYKILTQNGSDNTVNYDVTFTPGTFTIEPARRTIIVTTGADVVDDTDGLTSLREAMAIVYADVEALGEYVITFADDVTTVMVGSLGTNGLVSGVKAGILSGDLDLYINGDTNDDGVADVTITTTADITGAALDFTYLGNYTVNVELSNLIFAGSADGAVRFAAILDAQDATLTADNVSFIDNEALEDGAAIWSSNVELTVNNSYFKANEAGIDGGAIALEVSGNQIVSISNTTFEGNHAVAVNGGGAVIVTLNDNSALRINNSTFYENTTDALGGGIYIMDYSTGTATITNSTFTKNDAFDGGAIYNAGEGLFTVENTIMVGNGETDLYTDFFQTTRFTYSIATSVGAASTDDDTILTTYSDSYIGDEYTFDAVFGSNTYDTVTHTIAPDAFHLAAYSGRLVYGENGVITKDQLGNDRSNAKNKLGLNMYSMGAVAAKLGITITQGNGAADYKEGGFSQSEVRDLTDRTLTYGGVTVTGAVVNDFILSWNGDENFVLPEIGQYQIDISDLELTLKDGSVLPSAANDSLFEIKYEPGTFTVKSLGHITVQDFSETNTYGDALDLMEEKEAIVVNLVNGGTKTLYLDVTWETVAAALAGSYSQTGYINAGSHANALVVQSAKAYEKDAEGNYIDVTDFYTWNTSVISTLVVDKRVLDVTVAATDITKVYDGTTDVLPADKTGWLSVNNVAAGETITAAGTWAYRDANAGEDKSIDITGIALSYGEFADSANYSFTPEALATIGDITRKTITIDLGSVTKVYDGSSAHTADLSGSVNGVSVNGITETITYQATNGTYLDANGDKTANATANNGAVSADFLVTLGNGTNGGLAANYMLVAADGETTEVSRITTQGTITKRAISVTGADLTVTYDGQDHSLNGVSADNLVSGHTIETSYTLTEKNAGTYTYDIGSNTSTITILNGADDVTGNYEIVGTTNGTLQIDRRAITVTANEGQTKVYGSTDPVFTYTVDNLVPGEALNGALSREAGENVGSYAILQGTITNDNNANYDITFVSKDFTITKATLTVTAKDAAITYGEDAQISAILSSSYEVSGLQNGDAATVVTGSMGLAALSDAANYSTSNHLKADATDKYVFDVGSLNAGGNYEINFVNLVGTDKRALTVNRKTLVTDVDFETSKVYDGTTSVTVTSATLTNLESGATQSDDVTLNVVLAYNDANVATADTISSTTWNITGADVDNYILPDFTPVAGTITKRAISVTGADLTVTYDGQDHSLNGVSADNLVSGHTIETSYTLTEKNAGTYTYDIGSNTSTITILNGADDVTGNYEIVGTTNGTMQIDRRAITVTANEGQTKVYGSTDPVFTYTVDNIVTGETLTGELDRVAGENVGSYAILQGTITNDNNANYDITFVSKDFTITKATLTVTAKDAAITYGEDAQISAILSSSYEVSGLQNGDAATVVTGSMGLAALGDAANYSTSNHLKADATDKYVFDVGSLNAGGNYEINFVNLVGTDKRALTVNRKTLVTDVDFETSKVYDGTTSVTVTSATLTNLESGATQSDDVTLNVVLAYNDANVATADTISSTTWNITGADVDNYILPDFTPVAGTITKRALTVTAQGDSQVYGVVTDANLNNYLKHETTGFVTGEESLLTGSLTIDGAAYTKGNLDEGTYMIVEGTAFSAGNNYDVTYVDAELVITAKEVTLQWEKSDSYTYNGLDQSAGIKAYYTEVDGTKHYVDVTYSGAGTEFLNAGTYTVTAAGSNAGDNYKFDTAVLTNVVMNKLALTVTANDGTMIYGDTLADANTIGHTNGTLGDGDVLSVTKAYANSGVSTSGNFIAGTHGITITDVVLTHATRGDVTANYDITVESGTLTVNTRAITVTGATVADKTYDGNATATVTDWAYSNHITGDKFTFSGTALFEDKNAGVAKDVTVSDIVISGADAANYNLVDASGNVLDTVATNATINTKGVTATLYPVTKVYDGNTAATTEGGVLSGMIGNEQLTFTATDGVYNSKNVLEAHTAEFLVTLGDGANGGLSSNYHVENVNASNKVEVAGTITVASVVIDTGALTKEYDGTTTYQDITSTVNGVNGEVLGYTLSGGHFYAADGVTKTANVQEAKTVRFDNAVLNDNNGALASNYKITGVLDTQNRVMTSGTITAKSIEVSANDISGVIYGNSYTLTHTDATAGMIAGDVFSGLELFVESTDLNSTNTAFNVGTHTISFKDGWKIIDSADGNADVTSNYVVTLNDATLEIIKATITIDSVVVDDKIYDGNANANVSDYQWSANTAPLKAGTDDTLSVDVQSALFSDKNAADDKDVTVTFKLTGADAENYQFDTTNPWTTTATIEKKVLTVTALQPDAQVFGKVTESNLAGFLKYNVTGFVTGEEAIAAVSGDLSITNGEYWDNGGVKYLNAGSYAVTAANGALTSKSANYTIDFQPNNAVLTVTKAGVAVIVDAEKIYDASKIYDPASGNHNFTLVSDASGTLGAVLAPTSHFTLDSFTFSSDQVGNYSSTKDATTGSVSFNAPYLAKNYDLSVVYNGEITPRALTVNAGNYATVYNGADQTFTTAESTNDLGQKVSVTKSVTGKHAGTYLYDLSEADIQIRDVNGNLVDLKNFDLTINDGQLVIDKADVVITGVDQTMIYGNTQPALTYTFTIEGKAETALYDAANESFVGELALVNPQFSTSGNLKAGVWQIGQGTLYSIKDLNAANGGNYRVSYTPGATLTVEQREITLDSVDAVDRIYDGTDSAELGAYTLGNTVDRDLLQITAGNGAFNSKHATANGGATSAVFSGIVLGGADAENYLLVDSNGNAVTAATEYTDSNAQISRRDIKVWIDDAEKIYGSADPVFQWVADGLCTAVNETVTDITRQPGENAGDYAIDQFLIRDAANADVTGNYNVVQFRPGTLTIRPAEIPVTSFTVSGLEKIYDGDAFVEDTATLTFTFDNSLTGKTESVVVNWTQGMFDSKNVGEETSVTFTGLSSPDGNFVLSDTEVTFLVTDMISPLMLTHNVTASVEKVYDGTVSVAVSGGLTNVIGSDDVTLNVEYVYNSANVAEADKIINTQWSISGTDAKNYILPVPAPMDGAAAVITAKPVATEWQTDPVYYYRNEDQSGTVSAWYTDIYGNRVELVINWHGKVFDLPGEYAVTAENSDPNYKLTGNEKVLVMNTVGVSNVTNYNEGLNPNFSVVVSDMLNSYLASGKNTYADDGCYSCMGYTCMISRLFLFRETLRIETEPVTLEPLEFKPFTSDDVTREMAPGVAAGAHRPEGLYLGEELFLRDSNLNRSCNDTLINIQPEMDTDANHLYIESDLVNSDLTVKKVSLVCPESVFEEDAVEALDDVPEVQLVCPVADTAPVCKEEYEDLLDEFLNSPLLQFS